MSTPTNNLKWTLSAWVKRGKLSVADSIFGSAPTGTSYSYLYFATDNTLIYEQYNSGSFTVRVGTTQVFRDPSAWYHIVLVYDSANATSTNRILMYVNGVQVTAFATTTYPSLNLACYINAANVVGIASLPATYTSLNFDGYLTEVNFIDGQQLTPSSFGSTNATTGVWQPAAYTGTYGTNGFYLPFTDNSALTTSSNVGLGKDFSGNANYWVTNNISITAGTTYDSMTDVPTLTSATASNFAVLNPLDKGSNNTLSDGNLQYQISPTQGLVRSTFVLPSTGKWYCEATKISYGNLAAGIATSAASFATYLGGDAYGWGYFSLDGLVYNNNVAIQTGATLANGDVLGIAFDCSTGILSFYKNGTLQANVSGFTPATVNYFIAAGSNGGGGIFNFGQRPFSYTPPTGFVALNTFNLPTSTIVKGNTVMDATTYTGTLLSNAITNAAAFKPDLVWVKSRSAATDNKLTDSVRGVTKAWVSNSATAETTDVQGLTAFSSNGFTVGTNTDYNNLAATYVAWQWQAGQGSSSSNTNGTITSTVSVNASAGFSVVSFTGNGTSGATVGHSLGVAPSFIIIKRRATPPSVPDSIVYHSSLGNTGGLVLDQTVGTQTNSAFWNNTSPTSSVFSLGNDANTNNSGNTFIAYCWTPIAGFSAFGSYTGNGSTDGVFVYTGFRPKWLMVKLYSVATTSWAIYDSARDTYNAEQNSLFADSSSAEISSSSNAVDFLSNGFKLRTTNATWNSSGNSYIYMAFAENPFKNALAR